MKVLIHMCCIKSRDILFICSATVVILAFSGCGHERIESVLKYNPPGTLLLWAHSDIQPRNSREMRDYESALLDISENVPNVFAALVAGDIVETKSGAERCYPWFMKTREIAGVPYWYEIAGNHEARDLASFLRYTGKPLHYSVEIGNIIFIFMSDEKRTPQTEISDSAFLWWRKLVMKHRGRIIVTVTHACLNGSGLLSSCLPSMTISESQRFMSVLREYPVDIWISGHNHSPAWMEGKWARPFRAGGTFFLEVSGIRRDFPSGIESCLIAFRTRSRNVYIVPRDHGSRKFLSDRMIVHKTRVPFLWDGSPPSNITPCPEVDDMNSPSPPQADMVSFHQDRIYQGCN